MLILFLCSVDQYGDFLRVVKIWHKVESNGHIVRLELSAVSRNCLTETSSLTITPRQGSRVDLYVLILS